MTYPTASTLDADSPDEAYPSEESDEGMAELDTAPVDEGEDLDLDEEEVDDPSANSSVPGSVPGSAHRVGPSKASVRRVGAKVIQLQGADDQDLMVLASLYGVEPDPLEVTVAVMTSDRSALMPVRDLTDIAKATGFAAMVTAQEKGRGRMKAVHALLTALGGASTGSLNGNDAKASMVIAQDVLALPKSAKESLDRVLDLARRTS
ncbi:hypothetical protein CHO01_28860 [Cellulomonas hominis]|uniref:Uncharacterized protein n=1 Tax=Cellulomonas hominis TaxID=156981 RepID=A0A511FET9_9CELL|nr:hypothetical protein [Cellulomonas hominis]MBB5474763.1 hypothetical protein [Cellulomonas hominis]NKY05419.1 hypothetical protein [Cellulomonas hominis]GEL47770.1 hypothetical protein CHO01_28860 [Cellulomonas hominis]